MSDYNLPLEKETSLHWFFPRFHRDKPTITLSFTVVWCKQHVSHRAKLSAKPRSDVVVLQRTAKKMYQNVKRKRRAIVFAHKPIVSWRSWCRCRRRYLSSLYLVPRGSDPS